MALRRKRAVLAVTTAAAAIWLVSAVSVAGQGGAPARPQMAEEVFKDIRVLKGIPADEFVDVMGMFASSLGFDCTGCHVEEILDPANRAAFAVSTPQIVKARMMVAMVNSLNRTFFGDQKRVSCFSCHRGASGPPEVVPDFSVQYGEPRENAYAMDILPNPRISADEVFKTYWLAIGGRERLTALTSFVATGTYAGFNTGDRQLPVEIFARAPNLRAQVVKTFEGPAVTTFDGTNAWASEGWRPLPLMTFTGDSLGGARLDGLLAFPAGLQAAFNQWKGSSAVLEDDRQVVVLQGSNPGGLPVNLYFDDAGMLVRAVRWRSTAAGPVSTQTDLADYREVAGVRMPFRTVITWTAGRNTIQLEKVQPNISIDSSRFARPAPFQPQK